MVIYDRLLYCCMFPRLQYIEFVLPGTLYKTPSNATQPSELFQII